MSLAQPEDATTLDEDDKRERADWLRGRIVELNQEVDEIDRKVAPYAKAKREANKERGKLLTELRFVESGPTEDGDEDE